LEWKILVYFNTIWNIYSHLVLFMAVWYCLWSFGIIFPIWYVCTKKNLATLDRICFMPGATYTQSHPVFLRRNLRQYLQGSGRSGQDGRRMLRRRLIKEQEERLRDSELQRQGSIL
jgi:hypothetical protein